ncbi:MAG: hypothetical protein HZB11_03145 [Candidatus Yonathbacteria bacterium]|nr:hypothetical protein [Candidatus Yonathbacteria bacterium]
MNMKMLSIHSLRNILAIVIITGIGYMVYTANPSSVVTPKAEAGTGENVSGYIWSENIGWISLNSTTDGSAVSYGVNISPMTGTGTFSGNAWNSNIGWISFDRTATGNPPSAPFNGGSGPIAQVDWSTGAVTGWARALSACQNNLVDAFGNCTGSGAGNAAGGWDGWIQLSGTWANGVVVNTVTGIFSGYAWGDIVTGWIDFAPLVGGLPIPDMAIVSGLSCTQSNPTFFWGACTASCVGNPSPRNVVGTQTGACSDGTIPAAPITQSCGTLLTTCTATPGNPVCGDGVCSVEETSSSCLLDCKPKTKFWQF